ncbi:MAG: PD-(D/E)XK nuclease family protein, partial [Deltaproteobacteria bacterium]|nr:PD-(D/E)XK nuclease family protein [Deltaproteobacteria bacterium]
FEKIIDPSLRQAIKPAADIYAGLKASEAYLNQASSWKDFRDGLQSILINYGWPGLNAPESGALGRFTNQQSSDAIATANFAQVLIKLFDAMTISPEAPKVSMSSFKLWLNKALAREVVAESYGSGGIVLSSYYDLHGTFFEGLFLMGLNDRVFPSGKAENCWWPKAFVDGLATSFLGRRLWSDSAESYQREEELVASSLAQAKKVVLSYRAQDDNKRPSLPSPIIESLKGLWPEGQLAAEKISWPLPPPASRVCDPLELWLNLAINKPETNAPEEFLFLSNLGDSAASLWRSINDRRARTNLYETKITPAALNSWLDHQGRHQNLPVVTVSKFTAYQECHRRFWLTDILGLEPWPVPTDRWTPDIWGDVIHQTLERFLGPKLGVDGRDLNLTLLHYHFLELANRKACYRPTGRLPVWQAECQKYLELLKSWFERQPNPLVGRIEALEWSFGPGSGAQAPAFEINSPNGSFLIRGRVDRINRVNNCLEIVDYKTRRSGVYKDKPPEPGQERYAYEYQMILYAMAVAKQFKCHVTARLEFIDPGEGSPELTIPPGDESLFTEIWEELLSGQVGPTTDADACTYCDFQLFCGGGVNG